MTAYPPAPRWAHRRSGAICAAALAAGTLLASAGVASAAPQPSVSQVRQKLNRLLTVQDQAVQQYDQSVQELASARQQLRVLNRGVARYRTQFEAMRTQIAQLASAAYENGTLTSAGALLTANNPQTVISQAALISHLSTDQATEVRQLVAAARQLTSAQQNAQRAAQAIAALEKQQLARKQAVAAAVAKQRSILASLTTAQQTSLLVTGSTSGSYTGPTTTQADKAVAFAYAQLGKPYIYGGTGPSGYDCSGLTQAAWAAAGIAIPRTSYDQWGSLPHVPVSAMQPGDIMVFDGAGHVGIYVGNNELIDAPTTGGYVEKVAFSGWYASTFDGVVRP